MINYQLTEKMGGGANSTIIKIEDGVYSSFEPDSRNKAYRDYLAWLALGNIPIPANMNPIEPHEGD